MPEQDRTNSPTSDALRSLPLWARVAFAAHCARRVLPLFEAWEEATDEQRRAVAGAVEIAERAAAQAARPGDVAAAAARAAAADAEVEPTDESEGAAFAAFAASFAASAASAGADPATAGAFASSAAGFAVASEQAAVAAMWSDYDALLKAVTGQRWTDATPVPPSFFGPLWPDGEPEGWPGGGRTAAAISAIFISYRRSDSEAYAGRLCDRLTRPFRRNRVFMDIDAIPLGVNFAKVLSEAVGRCDVLLAVVGRNWVNAADAEGRRRMDSPSDFVRLEIEAALARGIPVVPLLVGGAAMPRPDELPESLRELAMRNGMEVRHASFHADVDRLIRALQGGSGRA